MWWGPVTMDLSPELVAELRRIQAQLYEKLDREEKTREQERRTAAGCRHYGYGTLHLPPRTNQQQGKKGKQPPKNTTDKEAEKRTKDS